MRDGIHTRAREGEAGSFDVMSNDPTRDEGEPSRRVSRVSRLQFHQKLRLRARVSR